MKLKELIVTVLFIFSCTGITLCQEKKVRRFALYYQQKIYLHNFDEYLKYQASDLPKLHKNARLHGAEFQGFLTDNIVIGLYANGTLNHKENSTGNTNWGGALACIFGQYRFDNQLGFFACPGLGLGCGRLNYASSRNDGSQSISIYSDAFYMEPMLSAGYSLKRKLYIKIDGAYICRISSNKYYSGNRNLADPFPNGFMLSASFGYRFPLL